MRPRVEWMNQIDDRILKFLDEPGLILSPAVIAVNLEHNRSWISRRIGKLVDAGFVEAINEGYYRITDFGSDHLISNLTAEEIEETSIK
jgi:predicted transcriptional regulator